jgi:hypothetical protein
MSDGRSKIKDDRSLEGPCPRCGVEGLKHALSLPRSMGSPAYNVFQCSACGSMHWLQQYGPED